MKVYRIIERILNKIILFLWIVFIKIHEKKNIRKKKKLWKNIKLTRDQTKQINDFYLEFYGKKISTKWHRLYMSYTGKFDYRYIPEYIYTTKMEIINNNRSKVLYFENKNLFDSLLSNEVIVPRTILRCQNKIFQDSKNEIVSQSDVIEYLNDNLKSEGKLICKPSFDTSSGNNVDLFTIENGLKFNVINDFYKKYGSNFIVQECLKQHEWLSNLHKESINTIRVMSYKTNNGFYTTPLVIRIGVGKSFVDNAHAGGIYIGIKEDGHLEDYAFTENGNKYSIHPDSKVEFKKMIFPFYKSVVEKSIEIHKKFSSFKFISYDFSIDENGQLVLIEWNLHSQSVWIMQTACGVAAFGDQTRYLLSEIKK